MPHWALMMSSDHLRCADLLGEQRLVTIVRVTQGEFASMDDPRKKLKKPELHMREYDKPLGLNSTNARAITKLLGSPRTEDWIGRSIILVPTTTKAFGEVHECIRIANRLPQEDRGSQPQPRAQGSQQQRPQTQQPPRSQARQPDPRPPAPPPDQRDVPPIGDDEARAIAELEKRNYR